jgi:hypothetical protein
MEYITKGASAIDRVRPAISSMAVSAAELASRQAQDAPQAPQPRRQAMGAARCSTGLLAIVGGVMGCDRSTDSDGHYSRASGPLNATRRGLTWASNSGPLFRGEPTRRSTGHTRSNPFGAGRSSAAQSPSASPTLPVCQRVGRKPHRPERRRIQLPIRLQSTTLLKSLDCALRALAPDPVHGTCIETQTSQA